MPTVDAYADSSFLVSLYRKDQNQPAANRFMANRSVTVGFSPLNRIELRNALRNLAARGEITEQERRGAFRQMDDDLDSGLLMHIAVNWTETLRRADELREHHATREGQRTIDLLHVAIALEAPVTTFLSFDRRQRRMAAAAGLIIRP
jgi:predicted nucleic acid-binding protein